MYNHAPSGYDCFVCRLVAGDSDAAIVVAESERAIAIVSSRVWGSSPGHVLVLPERHVENIYDLDDDDALVVHRLTRRVAIGLKEALACDGVSTRQHNEPAGGQDVWHYHVHVFPRYVRDGLYGSSPRDSTLKERRAFAERLRPALQEAERDEAP